MFIPINPVTPMITIMLNYHRSISSRIEIIAWGSKTATRTVIYNVKYDTYIHIYIYPQNSRVPPSSELTIAWCITVGRTYIRCVQNNVLCTRWISQLYYYNIIYRYLYNIYCSIYIRHAVAAKESANYIWRIYIYIYKE